MEETIETSIPPQIVWEAWEKSQPLETGKKGRHRYKYQILDVKKGESFSILWKSLFARLIFSHSVAPTPRGSLICYRFEIRGPFAWFLRKMLGKKIRRNLASVLAAFTKQLEHQGKR